MVARGDAEPVMKVLLAWELVLERFKLGSQIIGSTS